MFNSLPSLAAWPALPWSRLLKSLRPREPSRASSSRGLSRILLVVILEIVVIVILAISYVHLFTKTISGIVMLYHLWLEDAFALSPETKSSKYQINLSSHLIGGRMESQWAPRVRSKAEDRSFPSAKTSSVQCSYKIKITKRHMLMILLAKSCIKNRWSLAHTRKLQQIGHFIRGDTSTKLLRPHILIPIPFFSNVLKIW